MVRTTVQVGAELHELLYFGWQKTNRVMLRPNRFRPNNDHSAAVLTRAMRGRDPLCHSGRVSGRRSRPTTATSTTSADSSSDAQCDLTHLRHNELADLGLAVIAAEVRAPFFSVESITTKIVRGVRHYRKFEPRQHSRHTAACRQRLSYSGDPL